MRQLFFEIYVLMTNLGKIQPHTTTGDLFLLQTCLSCRRRHRCLEGLRVAGRPTLIWRTLRPNTTILLVSILIACRVAACYFGIGLRLISVEHELFGTEIFDACRRSVPLTNWLWSAWRGVDSHGEVEPVYQRNVPKR